MKRKHYYGHYEYFMLMQNQVCSSDGKMSYLFTATARPLKPGFHMIVWIIPIASIISKNLETI